MTSGTARTTALPSFFGSQIRRLGSLNALLDVSSRRFWCSWLKARLPCGDTLGRVAAGLDPRALRVALHVVYDRLKRNKALPLNLGRNLAVIDGREPRPALATGSG